MAEPFGKQVVASAPKQPLASMLASAERITSKTIKRIGAAASKDGGWKADAVDLFDLVGEHQFIVNSLAGRTGSARLFAGKLNLDDPTQEPEMLSLEDEELSSDDRTAFEALEAFGENQSGRAQLISRQSVNLSVVGDGYFLGIPKDMLEDEEKPQPYGGITPVGATDDLSLSDLHWCMLSHKEISTGDSGEVQVDLYGKKRKLPLDKVWLIRCWDPHPFKWVDSTSPTRSCLPVLRELVGLTQHVSAQIDSRLAGAGVFLVPQEALDAVKAKGIPDDKDDNWDPFTESLMKAMMTAIEDRSSASAMVPLVFTVPQDTIEGFKFMSFANNLDKEARALREEAIRRLALGMNAPPEVLLGVGSMNHWGAWLVAEDTIRTYVEPQLALICDALTVQYLWPVLEQAGVKDYKAYVIWYDVDHLIARPTRLQDAVLLHQEGVISDAALRDAGQFGDEDAQGDTQTADEASAIVLKMVQANPSLIRNPGIEALTEAVRSLLKGGATNPTTLPQAALPPQQGTEQQPIEGELMPLPEEGGPPSTTASASGGGWGNSPFNINVNVEPAAAKYTIQMPEGFAASAPVIHNHIEPTPVEIYNEVPESPAPEIHNHIEPTPVTVEAPEVNVNVEPPAVTVESPKVEVAAPSVNVAAPSVTVEAMSAVAPLPKKSEYFSGTSGRVVIPKGHRVVTVTAETENKAGSIKIGRGEEITLPKHTGFEDKFDDDMIVASSIVFKNTAAYYVKTVPVD